MYRNAGRKIQILAIVIFALGVIATLYWCVELWHAHDEGPFGGSPIPAILAFGILGTAASWAVGLLIHGYGELVDKVSHMANRLPPAPAKPFDEVFAPDTEK